MPGGPLDLTKLPSRAFDSPAQYAETAALAADYNHARTSLPSSMRALRRLADERIAAHPLRYYVWLPLGRMADMWLRPRVENLPIDLDWWVYAHHHAETRFSWSYAALNAVYLLLGIAGLCLRPRFWPWMLAYLRAAQRPVADRRSPRDALHAGVLPHAVCAGRRGAWSVGAEG